MRMEEKDVSEQKCKWKHESEGGKIKNEEDN